MKQVLCDTGALGFPVTPDTHGTMMDVVTAHGNVNSRMHLNTGNFCSAKFHHVVDMVNVVVFDNAEYTAHTADDTALLAMVDVVAADNVAAHLFL